MYSDGSLFYDEAMNMFRKAGHTVANKPISTNRTIDETIYFDAEKSVLVDSAFLSEKDKAIHVSHLFDVNYSVSAKQSGDGICYYSIVLECPQRYRSQYAHNLHNWLHQIWGMEYSVVVFCHDSNALLSIAGYGDDVILSDWYDCSDDFDALCSVIDISDLSLYSCKEFITDLIYKAARYYYTHKPPTGLEIYGYFPPTADENEDFFDKETMDAFVNKILSKGLDEYGDDYIEPQSSKVKQFISIYDELDRLRAELELDENESKQYTLDDLDYFDDEFNDEETEDFESEPDEYKYDDIDSEIFENAETLLKWLEMHDD